MTIFTNSLDIILPIKFYEKTKTIEKMLKITNLTQA